MTQHSFADEYAAKIAKEVARQKAASEQSPIQRLLSKSSPAANATMSCRGNPYCEVTKIAAPPHCRHPARRIWRLNSAGVRIKRSDEATKRGREVRHHIIPAADFQRDRRPFGHCEGRRRASGVPHQRATSRGCASPALLRREGSRQ
jgi:hypothetical protein